MLSLLWFTSALALPPMPALEPDISDYPMDVNVLCYPSGLQVVASRREGSTAVGISSVIGGGKSAETDVTRGAAHLLEHLWFRARPDGTTTVWDAASGLQITGSTWLDATIYTTLGSSADLPALLKLEGQRLVDPLVGVTDADIEAEKQIVKRELLYRGGDTQLMVMSALEESLYPSGHPYHGARVGPAQVDGLTRSKLTTFAGTYTPKGSTLYLEGDVPTGTDALAALIEANLPVELLAGHSMSCSIGRDQKVPEAPGTTEPVVLEGLSYAQRLYLGWTVPRGYKEDHSLMQLAVGELEDHLERALSFTSGLRGAQRERAFASCAFRGGRWASDVVCTLQVPEGVLAGDVLDRVRTYLREVDATQDYGSKVSQTGEMMAYSWAEGLQAQTRLSVDATETRARWAHFAESYDLWLVSAIGVSKAQPIDVVRFVRTWFTPGRMASVVLRPGPVPTWAEAASGGWQPTLAAHAPPSWTPVNTLGGLTGATLDNGVQIWMADQRGPGVPIAFTRLAMRGGPRTAPQPGLAEAVQVTSLWEMPFQDVRMRALVPLEYEFFGLSTGASSTARGGSLKPQFWMLGMVGSQMKLDDGRRQPTLNDNTEPVFGDAARTLDYISARPELFADAFRMKRLMPTATTAKPWWQRYHDARGLKAGEVRAWARSTFRPNNAALLVAGHVDPAEVQALADKYFGFWKAAEPLITAVPGPPGEAAEAEITLLPFHRPQSLVSVSCRVQATTPASMPALEVLRRLAARGLWQSLREDGRTYTPDVWLEVAHPEATVLHLEVEVLPGEAAKAIGSLRGLLALLAAGPDKEVLAHEILAARSDYGIDLSDAVGTQQRMLQTYTAGSSLQDLQTYGERLWAVDSAAIATAMQGCVGREAITVVGSDDIEALKATGVPARAADLHALAAALTEHMD